MNNTRCLFMTPEIRELAKKFPEETEESVKNLVGLWQEKRHKSPDTYPSELALKRFIKEIRNPAKGNQAGTLTNNLNKGENNNGNDKGRVAQGVQEGTQGHGNDREGDRGGSELSHNAEHNRSGRPEVLGRTRDYVTDRLVDYAGNQKIRYKLTPEEREDFTGSTDRLRSITVLANRKIEERLKEKGIKATSQRVRLANAHEFHEAISHARENPNGWMVDVHEESDYENYTCFLTGKCPVPYL